MGFFDNFSEDAQRYNWLLEMYPEATKEVYAALVDCGLIQSYGYNRREATVDVPIKFKKVLVAHESDVMEVNKFVDQERKKQQIVNSAKQYPHAYLYYCSSENISRNSIVDLGSGPMMPGEREFKSFCQKGGKKPIGHDDHFQQIVTKELESFGFTPRIPIVSNSSYTGSSIFASSLFNVSSRVKSSLSLLNSFSGTRQRPRVYGLFNSYSIQVQEFKEDISITKMYSHISEFSSREKRIVELLDRETKWLSFDKTVLGNEFGRQYYRAFFWDKYGQDNVGLDKYEALMSDLDSFNKFIDSKEKINKQLRNEAPNGFDEFKRANPDIPRSEYYKHKKEIDALEIQSKYVLYPERQTELNTEIESVVKKCPGWDTTSSKLDCAKEGYHDEELEAATCTCVYTFRYLIYERQFYQNEESDFKYCPEVVSNGQELDSLSKSEILNLFNEILDPILKVYYKSYTRVRILLGDDLFMLLEDNSRMSPDGVITHLSSVRPYASRIDVKPISYLMSNPSDHIPQLVLTFKNGLWPLHQAYFWQLVPSHIISTIVSLGVIVGAGDLCNYNEKKKAIKEQQQYDEIMRLKTRYSYGFVSMCNKYGINQGERESLIENYNVLSSHENDMAILQREHEAQLREEEKKRQLQIKMNKAQAIISAVPHAIKDVIPSYSGTLSNTDADTVIVKEKWLKEKEAIYYHRDELFSHQKTIFGIPHKYFYDYYPKSRYDTSEISSDASYNRSFIWSFKDGRSQDRAISLVEEFIKAQRIMAYKDRITLVCIPASSSTSNDARYNDFSSRLCSALGFKNGFEHVKLVGVTTPKRLGGTGLPDVELDKAFFKDSYVLLFDDLVTSGRSVLHYSRLLSDIGANCIGVISLGQTV